MSLYCELSNEENIKEFLKEAFIMKNRNEELKRKLKKAEALVFVQYWQAALQQEHIQELTI